VTDLESIVARRRLGKLLGADLVSWAVAALSGGLDSPSLRRLAGEDLQGEVRLEDSEALFSAALSELGISQPEEHAAIRAYVRSLAREIVDGKVAPRAQVDRIHREVLSPLNHPKDLQV
jgi:hypothetical protein